MDSDLIPPGLTYLADNIITRQNILGVTKEQGARWAHNLDLPSRAETVFFAGCGYQFSAQLEVLMSLARGIDKSVIGAELPMRFARFQKKLGHHSEEGSAGKGLIRSIRDPPHLVVGAGSPQKKMVNRSSLGKR